MEEDVDWWTFFPNNIVNNYYPDRTNTYRSATRIQYPVPALADYYYHPLRSNIL